MSSPYKLDHDKVTMAVDAVIKDCDKNFDECLVEKLIFFIQQQAGTDEWFNSIKPVMTRLKLYLDHRSFVMLNQTRALKIFKALLEGHEISLTQLNQVSSHLESLWGIIDTVVLNDNLGAIEELFKIFRKLAASNDAFRWLVNKEILPPIKIPSKNAVTPYEIKDVVGLTKYYIVNRKNYHSSNEADLLFETIVLKSLDFLDVSSPQIMSIRKTIRDLIIQGSAPMISILISTIKKTSPTIRERLFECVDLSNILNEFYQSLLEKSNVNVNNLCKLLAISNSEESFNKTLTHLTISKKIEEIVVYLSHSRVANDEVDQLTLIYILYPMLSNCQDEEAKILAQKLLATRKEKNLIDFRTSSRLISTCLAQLQHKINLRKDPMRAPRPNNLDNPENSRLIVEVLLHYICHQGSEVKNYRIAMTACSLLNDFLATLELENSSTVCQGISSIQEAVRTMNLVSTSKPIIIGLLRALDSAHRRFSFLVENADRAMINSCLLRTVELGFNYEDHDILDEFAKCLANNAFTFDLLNQNQIERFVELIWNHIYPKTRETDHRELLGHLASSLVKIDCEVDVSTLSKFDICRHHEIPRLLGDILFEKSAVLPTVELLIDAIGSDERAFPSFCVDLIESKNSKIGGYVYHLNSTCLPSSVQENLDHLIYGLCLTVKGESTAECRLKTWFFLTNLIDEMFEDSEDVIPIINRLIKTRVLETFYELASGIYPAEMSEKARTKSAEITALITSRVSDIYETLYSLMQGNERVVQDHATDSAKSRAIALFYAESPCHKPDQCEPNEIYSPSDKMEMSSLVDDILNYERQSAGVLDCY